MNLPDKLFGKSTAESYEKVLAESDKPPKDKFVDKIITPITKIITPTSLQTPENYILLPQTTEHPDLLIAKNRLFYDTEVDKAAKKLGLNLENNSQGYIGNINWEQALKLNNEAGNFTLNPKLFAEFLKLLKSGRPLDGKGVQVNSSELENILKEIIEVRSPYRAEWLDAKYSKLGAQLQVNYHKFDSSGKLIEVTETLDTDTMLQNKTPGINLDDWVNNPTSQGLPRTSVKEGNLYFWHPRESRVARFGAGPGGAYLGCNGDPQYSDSALGGKVFAEGEAPKI